MKESSYVQPPDIEPGTWARICEMERLRDRAYKLRCVAVADPRLRWETDNQLLRLELRIERLEFEFVKEVSDIERNAYYNNVQRHAAMNFAGLNTLWLAS